MGRKNSGSSKNFDFHVVIKFFFEFSEVSLEFQVSSLGLGFFDEVSVSSLSHEFISVHYNRLPVLLVNFKMSQADLKECT